ncbi:MAG: dTMP kinase [Gaiellales bacterium]|nr:dTMP kinase [Gaiellales bacterium]
MPAEQRTADSGPSPAQRDSVRFIAFEGADGAGKTTQARLLAAHLRALGREVVEVREPGGTQAGEYLRTLLLDSAAPLGARTEALLFAAARAQLVEDVIAPALARGATVIADRFVGSSLVYQGVVRGVGADAVRAINDVGTRGLRPDATVLLAVTAEQAAERRNPGAADRIEREPIEFHRNVIAAYEDVLASGNGRLVHVDGTGGAEDIAARVREALGL